MKQHQSQVVLKIMLRLLYVVNPGFNGTKNVKFQSFLLFMLPPKKLGLCENRVVII